MTPSIISISLSLLLLISSPTFAQNSLSAITSQYNLNAASFNYSVPGTTLASDEAQSYIRKNWDLTGRIAFGGNDIVFSPDPSTSTSTLVKRASSTRTTSSSTSTSGSISYPASTALAGESPVLRIEYPSGSYSKMTGGTQFYSAPINGSGSGGGYERMLLSYDVWFPSGFAWNMGGKLPGLRGGPDSHGCSGGNETDGSGCFSTRLMWRTNGAGEVYAYVPTTQPGFCAQSGVTCNSDFGTSLSRGSFSFVTGQWQTIWLLVILNEVGVANGVVQLYYNGVEALSYSNLELRSGSSISSIGGLFFSTFFGGDDSSWATPTTQYTYFKNMVLYAGQGAANGTGAAISGGERAVSGKGWAGIISAGIFGLGGLLSGLL